MEARPLKIQLQSLSDLVTENIMDFIMDGKIHMGEKLNTEELAQQLGVSRMPVRDAIKSLEKMGLVKSTPYVGSHLVMLGKKDVSEIYIGRKALEPIVAYYACNSITNIQIQEIEEIHIKLAKLIEGTQVSAKEIFLYNREFHFAIYRTSPFSRLVDMIESLWGNLAFCKLIYSQNYVNNSESAKQMITVHQELLNALKSRNAELIYAKLFESLDKNEKIIPNKVTEMLENSGRVGKLY